MATILTKKKDTTGAPGAGDLTNAAGGAELAVNTADKRLYTKDSGGNVVEIGTNPSTFTVTSPKVITGINDTNNNEIFKITATSSAVNEFTADYRDWETDRKSTRLNSSHLKLSRMPSSA